MLPSKLEYLTLAILYALITFTLLKEQVLHLLVRRNFWTSCLAFCLSWTMLEIFALERAWWIFNDRKVCGIAIAGLPVEEYFVFFLVHVSTTALWTGLSRDELA